VWFLRSGTSARTHPAPARAKIAEREMKLELKFNCFTVSSGILFAFGLTAIGYAIYNGVLLGTLKGDEVPYDHIVFWSILMCASGLVLPLLTFYGVLNQSERAFMIVSVVV
jgi:hypothetical protein